MSNLVYVLFPYYFHFHQYSFYIIYLHRQDYIIQHIHHFFKEIPPLRQLTTLYVPAKGIGFSNPPFHCNRTS